MLDKRTILAGKKRNLKIDNIKLFTIEEKLKPALTSHLNKWIQNNGPLRDNYKVADAGFRIAGTGTKWKTG